VLLSLQLDGRGGENRFVVRESGGDRRGRFGVVPNSLARSKPRSCARDGCVMGFLAALTHDTWKLILPEEGSAGIPLAVQTDGFCWILADAELLRRTFHRWRCQARLCSPVTPIAASIATSATTTPATPPASAFTLLRIPAAGSFHGSCGRYRRLAVHMFVGSIKIPALFPLKPRCRLGCAISLSR
jgi:hypothetical protein